MNIHSQITEPGNRTQSSFYDTEISIEVLESCAEDVIWHYENSNPSVGHTTKIMDIIERLEAKIGVKRGGNQL